MIELVKNLTNNLAYVTFIAFIVTRLTSLNKIIQKNKLKKIDLAVLSLIFGGFGIIGTYIGTNVNGAIANTRIIGVMTGGILCGPFVGIASGIIAGLHRISIDIGGITALPCSINTIVAGFISAFVYKKSTNKNKWMYGFVSGLIVQSLEMIFILLLSKPFEQALNIVKSIYVPMSFTNAAGICILIILIQNIYDEKDEIAAKESKLALEIANKTLPYFREINNHSFEKICEIVKESIGADAVSMTDTEKILAHVGVGADHHIKGGNILTQATEKVLENGEILVLKNAKEIKCPNEKCRLRSAIIAPVKDGDNIIGTLKIYYVKEDAITFSDRNLAIGLSQIISTQLEISKVSKLQEMANKAEIKALQTQINPHFLFNALNTIASFVRIDPNKARELIINLSTYLRYNLETGDNLVDVQKELQQVKAYVEIEKARFGDKLEVRYNIEDNIDIKIPNLIIQPIVENAIKHGILKGKKNGNVDINIKKLDNDTLEISIEDDGVGIDNEIVNRLNQGTISDKSIGLTNVHNRLKFIYGNGLKIERLHVGTRMTMIIKRLKE